MKKQTSFIMVLILTLLVVVFAILNVSPVSINFGFAQVKLPMVVILILTLLLGALIVFLLSTTSSANLRRQNKALKKQLADLQEQQADEIDQAVGTAKKEAQQKINQQSETIADLRQQNHDLTKSKAKSPES